MVLKIATGSGRRGWNTRRGDTVYRWPWNIRLSTVGLVLAFLALMFVWYTLSVAFPPLSHVEKPLPFDVGGRMPSLSGPMQVVPSCNAPQQQQQQAALPETNSRQMILPSGRHQPFPVVVDILSVGSMFHPEQQHVQRETMGTHPSVRHFVTVTEADDTERTCHTHLTKTMLKEIAHFCVRKENVHEQKRHFALDKMRRSFARMPWLIQKKNPLGWMCAQKRPTDAFRKWMELLHHQTHPKREQQHQQQTSSWKEILPDYLIIMDDDSWVNLDHVLDFLQTAYPVTKAYAVAGCMIRSNIYKHNMTLPFGGFSVFLNRPTLQNFLQPLNCSAFGDELDKIIAPSPDDTVERLACWRLTQNAAGERHLFRDGMSVADLMVAYVFDQPYLTAAQWWLSDTAGFCMHSDWVWGYFINYYHLSVHTTTAFYANVLQDRLVGYNGSEIYAGSMLDSNSNRDKLRQCNHKDEARCQSDAHICHRISPPHMRLLHKEQLKMFPTHNAGN